LTLGDLAPITALAVGALMLATWLLSLARRDASIVDVVWGLGFAMIAVIGAFVGTGNSRTRLVATLTLFWGIRLAGHLYQRNRGTGEDYRYAAMRRRWGNRFPVVSLFTVFLLQGVLMFAVSLPVQAAQTATTPSTLTAVDAVGTALWLTGFLFEVVGDEQLRRFKADPENEGEVMDRGLWRYTRHPNYFGDATLWWGLGVMALATGAWWSVVGPIVMTVLLLRVSGVPLLERRLKRTRPAYAEYAARTSSFIPLPPNER
jgi:steroid 5-alpha reductase family enzyme